MPWYLLQSNVSAFELLRPYQEIQGQGHSVPHLEAPGLSSCKHIDLSMPNDSFNMRWASLLCLFQKSTLMDENLEHLLLSIHSRSLDPILTHRLDIMRYFIKRSTNHVLDKAINCHEFTFRIENIVFRILKFAGICPVVPRHRPVGGYTSKNSFNAFH